MLKIFKKSHAFTLAEVLITLAIIGVVAAMTIPTLITKINDRVRENQIKVIEKRFVEGLNLFNTLENGMSGRQYTDTKEFVEKLSKHFKVTTICDKDNLQECWPYGKINYDKDGKLESIEVNELGTKLEFPKGENQNFLEPAGFITASGVPFIIGYDSNCLADPDTPMKEISSCISGIYDLNGNKTPNKWADDIQVMNGAQLKTVSYLYEDDDIKIISFYKPTDGQDYFTKQQCTDLLGADHCYYETDYWAWSMDKCQKDGGSLPTLEQLGKMASKMYNGSPTVGAKQDVYSLTFNADSALAKALGVSAGFYLWSSEEDNSSLAYLRGFLSSRTEWDSDGRDLSNYWAVCVEP